VDGVQEGDREKNEVSSECAFQAYLASLRTMDELADILNDKKDERPRKRRRHSHTKLGHFDVFKVCTSSPLL